MKRLLLLLLCAPATTWGLEITLPTANDALYEPGGEGRFFQGTAGHDWRSGTFGCVRTGGRQFHEGVDIRCVARDRRGEPTDAVVAVAAGEVAYVAGVAGQSNYGRYVLVRHQWDGVEVFSLYSHLGSVAAGLRAGRRVTRGEPVGTLGYSGTQNIPKERAHLHFELCFQLNCSFAGWFAPRMAKGQRNDHGSFNGLNFQGIDPAMFFRAFRKDPGLGFREYMEAQRIAFTILFPGRRPPLSWMRAQQWCIVNGPEPAPVTAYEVWFTAEGVPTFVRPRWDRAVSGVTVWGVDPDALAACPCRGLVFSDPKRSEWRLTERGLDWMDLLSF